MSSLPSPPPLSAAEIRLATEIIRSLQDQVPTDQLLQQVVPSLLSLVGASGGGLVRQRDGQWDRQRWFGELASIPELLIGEAIDAGQSQTYGSWWVAPVERQHSPQAAAPFDGYAPPAALVLHFDDANGETPSCLPQTIELFSAVLGRLQTREHHQRRIEQLTAILNAAAQWQQLDDDEALLHRIAGLATELLHCERASIFLWDKRRRKLVGRPALGIDGGALEVDDHAGIVGEVLRSQEPRFWDSRRDEESRINRSVDQSHEFETRSLVAVPMVSGRGQLIGVFEAINHRDDRFDPLAAAVLHDLATHAAVAIESLQERQRLTENRDRLVADASSAAPLIGRHDSIEAVRQRARKIATTDLSVLILGQNGTGKEVLARRIHYDSQRRNGPFIAVNCAALVETLLESELFGHEKGAFTDANQTRVGKFELASGGTLFLDEIGDMSPNGQAKLLRVLEEKVVVRVGGSQPIAVDVRVIAATNQPLEELIQQRRFREDLFFRLNVVALTLPPLCQRGDDVIELTRHFLQQFCYQIGRPVPQLQPSALSALRRHPWPGNIRELRNTVERICYLCSEDQVTADDLMLSGAIGTGGAAAATINPSTDLNGATREFQVDHITRAIAECRGNMTEAAERLGLHRSNLYRKMRQLGMPTSD